MKILLRNFPRSLVGALILTCILLPVRVLQSKENTSGGYVSVTISDVNIPLDQLQWLVKPLTKEELTIEVNAWQDILKQKVKEISAAEISVKRQNEQIEKSIEVADAAKEAKEAAKEAEDIKQKAAVQGDTTTAEKAAQIAEEALKKAEDAKKAVEEVEKAEEKSQNDEVSRMAQQAVQQIQEQKREEGEPVPGAPTSGEVTISGINTQTQPPAENLESVAQEAKVKADSEAEQKNKLLTTLTELRTQRTALIERFNVVLDELKAKGGDVESYVKYRDAVDEVMVDVSDTSAVWTFIKGWLSSEKGGIKWAVNLSKFAGILVIFYLIAIIIGKVVRKATASAQNMSQLLKDFINTFARRSIIAIGLLVAVSALNIPITPLLAIITAAGLVIGLALQGTLSNFASGLLLLLYRPFDIGDLIDAGGTVGTVSSMNLMSTIIKTLDNKVMVVPNNSIWGSVITNISRTERRRIDMVFGISYSDSIERTQAILEEIVKNHPDILEDPPPVVRVHELGDSSVNFVVRPWVLPVNYWEVYWDITRKVKEEFDRQGICIPFPQRDVHFYPTSRQPATKIPASESPETR